MPDTKLTIIITGIAICNYTEELFESIFLYVERHELDLYVTKTKDGKVTTETYKIPAGSMASVTSTKAQSVNPASADPDKSYDRIININEINGKPIPFRNNPSVKLTYLSVEGAVCYTAKMSYQNYNFWRVKDGKKEKLAGPMPIGLEIGIDFFIAEGGNVELMIDKVPLNFPQEDGVEYELKFDNECTAKPEINDFEFYFEVLSDADGKIEELFAAPDGEAVPETGENACNPIQDPTCDLYLYMTEGRCQ